MCTNEFLAPAILLWNSNQLLHPIECLNLQQNNHLVDTTTRNKKIGKFWTLLGWAIRGVRMFLNSNDRSQELQCLIHTIRKYIDSLDWHFSWINLHNSGGLQGKEKEMFFEISFACKFCFFSNKILGVSWRFPLPPRLKKGKGNPNGQQNIKGVSGNPILRFGIGIGAKSRYTIQMIGIV